MNFDGKSNQSTPTKQRIEKNRKRTNLKPNNQTASKETNNQTINVTLTGDENSINRATGILDGYFHPYNNLGLIVPSALIFNQQYLLFSLVNFEKLKNTKQITFQVPELMADVAYDCWSL